MALAAILIGILLVVGALVLWQHASRGKLEITFGIEDAVEFVMARLPEESKYRVREGGVRRILEWEIYYLQGLAQERRRVPVETVAGAYRPAVEYIRGQISQRHGLEYAEGDIEGVLELGVEYLASIGAVGDPVGGFEK
ncbi:MAG TPA: hypothetical protein VJ796_11810 [Acidimicrobiia bacterium]|jgi:hypothetical protein|nr:hypothetical protein [Acidimicrobiia bacterium]